MFVGRATDTSFLPGTITAISGSFGYDALLSNVKTPQNDFNDFGNPNLNFPGYAGLGTGLDASGGFLLYPSKPNANSMQSVYSKR